MSQRNQWLDIAKGIAILLMVIGHSTIPQSVSNFIFAFHMPLFFISSGLVTNFEKYSAMHFIAHKLRTLLLPFLIYSSIVIILLIIAGISDINHVLYNGWEGYALWFIPVLFFSLIINKIKQIKMKYIRIALVLCILISGAVLCYYSIYLPWSLSTIPYASFLIFLGGGCKSLGQRIETIKNPIIYIWILAILTITISHFWRLDMAWNHIRPVVPLTIGAISGTLMLFLISIFIYKHTSVLSWIL